MLSKILDCKIKNVYFSCVHLFYIHYLYVTVQYYVASRVSWVPRLALLDLWTNGLKNMLLEWNSFVCRGFTLIKGKGAEIKSAHAQENIIILIE